MSGGHGAHVDSAIWMRAVMMGGMFLTIGVLLFATLGVFMANEKHHVWEDLEDDYHHMEVQFALDSSDEGANISEHEAEELDHLHHEEIAAHLSYLTYRVAGITILLMSITYAAFIGVGGFLNASKPNADDDHGDGHGDGYGDDHHGSSSPIIFAFGIMLFLAGFPDFVIACKAMLNADITPDFGMLGLSMVGLLTIVIAVSNWWFEDLPFNGHGEQIATSYPFEGEHIRKAGLWVFIMSEIMVFATFFSSYLRMRTEWCTDWAIESGVEACSGVEKGTVVTASDLLRNDFATLLPGAINTFALIISSYTIVLALKTAKNTKWERSTGIMGKLMPTRKAEIRNYLIATLALGSLFIVLKLVEWSHLVAEGFDIGTTQGSIFYIATGAHGLHVFIGLLVMLYLVFKADTVGYDEDNAQGIEYFGLYWHFVDLAWVVIFPAFYLY
ncbi:MAG: heme-copper oxidase subunit III [Euryarchaeota archaeon TMED99]|nr:MAG: heme-copper oxidase subunit III [Euryarchaeota archaeon TMED99]